jgi:hypothetical protein
MREAGRVIEPDVQLRSNRLRGNGSRSGARNRQKRVAFTKFEDRC